MKSLKKIIESVAEKNGFKDMKDQWFFVQEEVEEIANRYAREALREASKNAFVEIKKGYGDPVFTENEKKDLLANKIYVSITEGREGSFHEIYSVNKKSITNTELK